MIRDSNNLKATVRRTALKIFPDELSWLQKKCDINLNYKNKIKLRADLLNLYELYESVAKDERLNRKNSPTTDEDIDNLLNRLN